MVQLLHTALASFHCLPSLDQLEPLCTGFLAFWKAASYTGTFGKEISIIPANNLNNLNNLTNLTNLPPSHEVSAISNYLNLFVSILNIFVLNVS